MRLIARLPPPTPTTTTTKTLTTVTTRVTSSSIVLSLSFQRPPSFRLLFSSKSQLQSKPRVLPLLSIATAAACHPAARGQIRARNRSQTRAMSSKSEKLIFAPAGTKSSAQADQYVKGTLSRAQLDASPLTQFHSWFASARESGVFQPETVCLSTASLPSGAPSSRFVYLKELDSRGFVVYSNWGSSRKAADVASNPQAALAFWWREVERQVRVEGHVERLSSEESQTYYSTRARGSKIGAWASEQSSVLSEQGSGDDGRAVLDSRVEDVEKKFIDTEDADIPVPDFWGGLRLIPSTVEFWQGRDSRLHDRFRYTWVGAGKDGDEGQGWKIERLSP